MSPTQMRRAGSTKNVNFQSWSNARSNACASYQTVGELGTTRHCSAPRRLIARSFETRCTVPVQGAQAACEGLGYLLPNPPLAVLIKYPVNDRLHLLRRHIARVFHVSPPERSIQIIARLICSQCVVPLSPACGPIQPYEYGSRCACPRPTHRLVSLPHIWPQASRVCGSFTFHIAFLIAKQQIIEHHRSRMPLDHFPLFCRHEINPTARADLFGHHVNMLA